MKQPRQFPMWIQHTIGGVAILCGAWYIVGSWIAWAFQLANH